MQRCGDKSGNLRRCYAYGATVAFLVLMGFAQAGEVSRATADWLKINGPQMSGRPHALQVAYVEPAGVVDGVARFYACTWGVRRDERGGWILVYVPSDQAGNILKKFGTSLNFDPNIAVRTKRLDGVVIYDPDDGSVAMVAGISLEHWKQAKRAAGPSPREPETSGRNVDASRPVRTWVSADGRSFQGELLSVGQTTAKIRRQSDGRVFDVEIVKLSRADQDYIEAQR